MVDLNVQALLEWGPMGEEQTVLPWVTDAYTDKYGVVQQIVKSLHSADRKPQINVRNVELALITSGQQLHWCYLLAFFTLRNKGACEGIGEPPKEDIWAESQKCGWTCCGSNTLS